MRANPRPGLAGPCPGLAGLLGTPKMIKKLVNPCKNKHLSPNPCLRAACWLAGAFCFPPVFFLSTDNCFPTAGKNASYYNIHTCDVKLSWRVYLSR